MSALVHVDQEEEVFYEREISARFENGKIEITVRGESLGGVLEILLKAVAGVELNPDSMMDLTLTYWHLTEDLDRVEITASAFQVEEYSMPLPAIVRRLMANAKMSLVKNLARHHIALRGEKGEL
jgi:hypothetical protein